ncbi:MAG: sodium:solute symporter family protein [Desulfurococcales archaeon]|nr:sodium:solute symporter family protein [Desulfurococcales archaeon]
MAETANMGLYVLIGVIIYSIILLSLGYIYRVKRLTLKDYFLGGKTTGALFLFFTLYATQYSGNTFVSYAGRAYRLGFWWVVSVPFFLMIYITYLWFAPRLYVISKKRGYITPADFIKDRFNSPLAALIASLLMLYGLSNYLLEQVTAMGHSFEGITQGLVPYWAGALFLVMVMVIYEWLGGWKGVIWTDFIQGAIMVTGLIAVLFIIAFKYPLSDAIQVWLDNEKTSKLVMPPPSSFIKTWLAIYALVGIGAAIYPQAIQRIYAAKDEKALKRSISGLAFMPLITPLVILLIGIEARYYFPDLGKVESDKAFPLFMSMLANEGVIYFFITLIMFMAVLAAIQSTADSVLLSIGSMVSKDLYKEWINREADEKRSTLVGKLVSVILIGVIFLIGMTPKTTLWHLTEIKFEVLIQAAPAFLLGIYWKRMAKIPTIVGMVAGAAVAVGMKLTIGRYMGIYEGLWGLLVNLIIVIVGSLLIKDRESISRAEELFSYLPKR